MKLRIRGNTIRLRLLQSEVAAFGENGVVEESIRFGNGDSVLTYCLKSTDSDSINTTFRDNYVTIEIPRETAGKWVNSEEVGISHTAVEGENKLEILVEKDFECLTRTDDPDNLDAFPNPESENC